MPSVCSKKGIWAEDSNEDVSHLKPFKSIRLFFPSRLRVGSYGQEGTTTNIHLGFRWLNRELAPEPLADWGKEDAT